MAERRIGVAMDFSPNGKYALQWALDNIVVERDHVILVLVNKEEGEAIIWEESGSPLVPLYEFEEVLVAKKYGVASLDPEVFSMLDSNMRKKNLTVVFKVYWGDARDKLCDSAVDLSLNCLVVGSRGLGTIKRIVLGSVSNYVVNHAPCPVTV
eukprot:c24984_g2_i1 orf=94-552(+)